MSLKYADYPPPIGHTCRGDGACLVCALRELDDVLDELLAARLARAEEVLRIAASINDGIQLGVRCDLCNRFEKVASAYFAAKPQGGE